MGFSREPTGKNSPRKSVENCLQHNSMMLISSGNLYFFASTQLRNLIRLMVTLIKNGLTAPSDFQSNEKVEKLN